MNSTGPSAGLSPRNRLAALLAPELLDAVEELIDERVAERLTEEFERRSDLRAARWLTLEQAAEMLGCSPAAVRMRANRGRLEKRHSGRRVYVSAASVAELG